MRRLLTVLGTLVAIVGVLAVGAAADTHYPQSAFDAQLAGANEVPAVTTDGTGYASATVSEDGSSIDYRLYVEGLDDVTMAHIHVGAAGANGPVAVFLFGPMDPGVVADGLLAEGTITEADLVAIPGVFDGTMTQLVELIGAGETYVNVHTETNPSGEIRGQLQPAAFNFSAPLAGSSEIPAVDTAASGVVTLSLNDAQTAVSYTLLTYGLVDTVQAHLHVGSADENGPVVVFLFGPEPSGVSRDGILAEGSFTEMDLIDIPGLFDGTMEQFIDYLRAGDTYANVHTLGNAGGEIRGQVGGLERVTAGERFTDDDSSIHEGDIESIAAGGVTRGCNPPVNDEFCPQDVLTRGQAAAFFKRALNLAPGNADLFDDDDESIFEADIDAIATVGITVGCNPPANDSFCPDDTVTRAQWASFMVRALGLSAGADDDQFTDDDGSVHEGDIEAIAAAGITAGCNPPANDRFCPDDPVTREQAASFFARALEWRDIGS